MSRGLEFTVSPIALNRWKTNFHEWGHIVLGHTMPSSHEEYVYHRGLMEAEAEILAMLCMKSVGLLDKETARYIRRYVQHWLGGNGFPEISARKVLKGADDIPRVGWIALTEPTE